MSDRGAVQAATFRAWYEILEEIVAQDAGEIAAGNQRNAVMLLHDLVAAGVRHGAIHPVVIRSSGPSSHAHLMFRYTRNPEFDWAGEIDVGTGAPIAEFERATGISDFPSP